jgi:hypothetical protein
MKGIGADQATMGRGASGGAIRVAIGNLEAAISAESDSPIPDVGGEVDIGIDKQIGKVGAQGSGRDPAVRYQAIFRREPTIKSQVANES